VADFTVTVGLNNGAIRGNTRTLTVHVDDEDLEGLSEDEREQEVDSAVAGEVLAEVVYWDWKPVDG